ncbi:MAG: hypothetical protein GY862_16620 [Gammaproteobacteria bacterium]|nr:hypothetical protein [Gammaproteobacteria bacterium]
MRKIIFLALTLLLACAVRAADVSDLQTLLTEGATAWKHSDYPAALKKWEQGLKLARQLNWTLDKFDITPPFASGVLKMSNIIHYPLQSA